MLKAQNIYIDRRLNIPDFELHQGQITVVLGSNGAGKSTLISVLSGEITLPGVTVTLDGQPITDLSYQERAARMAVLGQRQQLDFDFPVADVIKMGADPLDLKVSEIEDRLTEIASALSITHLLARKYTTLSGGETQRVQLARVLMQRPTTPGLLLLDEPLTALDLRSKATAMRYISALKNEGHTVLVVLHDLNLAAQYADRFLLITEGGVLAEGTHEVLTPERLSSLYEIEVIAIGHTETGHPQFSVAGSNF